MQSPIQPSRLLIVYNADSGLINALMHAVHKQLYPETYPCSLCAITYGAVSMHGEWKRFLEALPLEVVFHHKDDFAADYPDLGEGGADEIALPAILIAERGSQPKVLLSAAELDATVDTIELMESVEERLSANYSPALSVRVSA